MVLHLLMKTDYNRDRKFKGQWEAMQHFDCKGAIFYMIAYGFDQQHYLFIEPRIYIWKTLMHIQDNIRPPSC